MGGGEGYRARWWSNMEDILRWWCQQLEVVVGGGVRRKKGKKICKREWGTGNVCFAAGDELRRLLVVETMRGWREDGGWGCDRGGGRWQRKQKKKKKTGGAVERKEKLTVALSGRLVVVLASCGKIGDECGGGWTHCGERKKREDNHILQAIKSTSIYRRWKRAILSTLEKNFSPWFIFIRLSRSYNLDSEFFSLFSIDLNLFWLFFIFF
jgi:hypothetical protein